MSLAVSPPVVAEAGWTEGPLTVLVTTGAVDEPPSIAVAARAPPPAPRRSAAESVAAVRVVRRVEGIGSPGASREVVRSTLAPTLQRPVQRCWGFPGKALTGDDGAMGPVL